MISLSSLENVCETFTVNPLLIFIPNQSNYIVNLSELRYKNITEDKNFSYLTKHAEYITLTFRIQSWFENKTKLTFISNSPLSTWDLYTSNINLHTLMFYIAVYFSFLKIFFDWFTFFRKHSKRLSLVMRKRI